MSEKPKTKSKLNNSSDKVLEQARKLVKIATGMLLLAALLLLLAYRVEKRTNQQPIAIPQTPVALRQAISMGAVELKVESVTFETGQQPFLAPAGKKYAIATMTIKNKSDKPIQVLPSNDTYMKNEAGDVAHISPYSLTQPFRGGELSPGERMNGELSFLVKDNSSYKLYIDAIWSGGVIPFATL